MPASPKKQQSDPIPDSLPEVQENPYTQEDEAQPSVRDLLDKFASLNDEAEAEGDEGEGESAHISEGEGEGDDNEGEGEGDDNEGGDDGEEATAEATTSTSNNNKKKKKKKSKASKALQKLKDLGTGNQPIPEALMKEVRAQAEANGAGSEEIDEAEIQKALRALNAMKILKGEQALGNKSNTKDLGEHKFWKTQPVPQTLNTLPSTSQPSNPNPTSGAIPNTSTPLIEGPIDSPKTPSQIKQSPLPLRGGYEWSVVDVLDETQRKEAEQLLSENYVEDDEASFRLNYSKEFLLWSLTAPGYVPDWHLGVRVSNSKKLVAFISGIKVDIRVRDNTITTAEINFLCVHKKLRSKRLAPVLIKEITRRINLKDIWQAVYTAGVVLPTPFATCRYLHRNLNPPKLVEIGFTPPPGRGSTIAKMIKQYALPTTPVIPGFREMVESDVEQVGALLRKYMARFQVSQTFAEDGEIRHWFLSGKGKGEIRVTQGRVEQVTWVYVVEDPSTHQITDVVSFYSLPSLIMKNPKHAVLNTAYAFYYASDVLFTPGGSEEDASVKKRRLGVRLNELIKDAMIIAKGAGFDVFNALTLMDNNLFLQEQQFGLGDGYLNYYLYNWQTAPMNGGHDGVRSKSTSDIGIVML